MPEKDGYSLIRKIRMRPREKGGSIPAIALTAFAGQEDRKRDLDSGWLFDKAGRLGRVDQDDFKNGQNSLV